MAKLSSRMGSVLLLSFLGLGQTARAEPSKPLITSVCEVRSRPSAFKGKSVRLAGAFIWTDGHHGAAIDDPRCRSGINYDEPSDKHLDLPWAEINPMLPTMPGAPLRGNLGFIGTVDGKIVVKGRAISLLATAADVKVGPRPPPICANGLAPKVGTESEAERLAGTALPPRRKSTAILSVYDSGWTWIVTKIGDDPLEAAPSVEIEKCSGAVSRWP
jgi:hypothetical protein